MTKTVSEILFAAADLIEPEGAWTQGHSARNAEGDWTDCTGPEAVCWCLLGAVVREAANDDALVGAAVSVLENELGGFVSYNDAPERTQEEVVAKLREAAEKAREQGQ